MEQESFTGQLGNYKVLITEDGSPTLWSENYKEACHSLAGANKETDLYYIQGCKIAERAAIYSPLCILEIGFGLGVGYERTLKELNEKAPQSEFFYLSVEQDETLLTWSQQRIPSTSSSNYPSRQNLQKGFFAEIPCWRNKTSAGELVVLIGEARECMATLEKKFQEGGMRPAFHAIYQDAFSPLKNAELWTVEWFTTLQSLAHLDCILSTFSASSRMRKALVEAGWKVHEGERMGSKRASTYATLHGESSTAILQRLQRSPVKALVDKERTMTLKFLHAMMRVYNQIPQGNLP